MGGWKSYSSDKSTIVTRVEFGTEGTFQIRNSCDVT